MASDTRSRAGGSIQACSTFSTSPRLSAVIRMSAYNSDTVAKTPTLDVHDDFRQIKALHFDDSVGRERVEPFPRN